MSGRSADSSDSSLAPPFRSRNRTRKLSVVEPTTTRETDRTDLEGLLSKVSKVSKVRLNPDLMGDLLKEFEGKERATLKGDARTRRAEQSRIPPEDKVGDGDGLDGERPRRDRERRRSRTKIGNSNDLDGSSSYPPAPHRQHEHHEDRRYRVHGEEDDVRTQRRASETETEDSEESGSQEEGTALLRRGREQDDGDAGPNVGRQRKSRTAVSTGSPETVSAYLRGRSSKRQARYSNSASPSASPSPSPSASRASSPPHTRASSSDSHTKDTIASNPLLRPFHAPKINVDFEFPSSFNRDGLPTYAKNEFLPARLQGRYKKPLHFDAPDREILEEEGMHWGDEAVRGRRRTRYEGPGEGESGGGGPTFSCLLALVLVVLPIALLSVVLGLVFRFVEVKN